MIDAVVMVIAGLVVAVCVTVWVWAYRNGPFHGDDSNEPRWEEPAEEVR